VFFFSFDLYPLQKDITKYVFVESGVMFLLICNALELRHYSFSYVENTVRIKHCISQMATNEIDDDSSILAIVFLYYSLLYLHLLVKDNYIVIDRM